MASIAYRTCYTHLRRLYPQRARLKNRLRYALTYDPDLSIEQDAFGIWRCGLTEWAEHQPEEADPKITQEFRNQPGAFARGAIPDFADQHLGIADAVKALLERVAQPISHTLMYRQYLSHLWDEVCELPINQRIAILLNLRDDEGRSALPMLPPTGIATIRRIAEVLNIPALELAALWPELPLDDARIAERLALKRQQVINLRKSARERLGRRMARYGW